MMKTKYYKSSKHQSGSTLIEVLVSMFIILIGLMGLLAMQVRTSATIKEAEYNSIIAQATQNLAESMMTNPLLVFNNPRTEKDYSGYTAAVNRAALPAQALDADGNVVPCADDVSVFNLNVTGRDAARAALINVHANRFVCSLSKIPQLTAFTVNVEPIAGCAAGGVACGNELVVRWTMQTGSDGADMPYEYRYAMDDNI